MIKDLKTPLLFFVMIFALLSGATDGFAESSPTVYDYLITDISSGDFFDAEKSPSNPDDNLMCWAASASNILAWTGWGNIYSYSEDEIFTYYQDHWTDDGGLPAFAWEWWFDGTNESQGDDWADAGWSQVDAAGGGFFPEENFFDYYREEPTPSVAMSAIDTLLHDAYGISIGIYGDTVGGHALTVWGYRYDDSGNYLGLYVSDSDDDKWNATPEDEMAYYDVAYNTYNERWYLPGYSNWYIGAVQGLAKAPYETGPGTVPEPSTFLLLGLGLAALGFNKSTEK